MGLRNVSPHQTPGSRVRAAVLVATFGALLAGCGTYGGQPLFVVYPHQVQQDDPLRRSFAVRAGLRYDQVWQAAVTAMGKDMDIIESHKPSGTLKSRVGSGPSGKIVGFWITPTTPEANQYVVHTLSLKPIGLNSLNGKGWEPQVVDDFLAALPR